MASLASLTFVGDLYQFVASLFARQAALRAENAFLRKQLAMFVERGMRPRRARRSERRWLVVLAKLFAWRGALCGRSLQTSARVILTRRRHPPGRRLQLRLP